MSLTAADLRIDVTFEEHEARFLSGLCLAAALAGKLSDDQNRTIGMIASKFAMIGNERKRELIEQHGVDAVVALAKETLAAHPGIEEVAR